MKTFLEKFKLFSVLTLILVVIGAGLLPTPSGSVITPKVSAACNPGTYPWGGKCVNGYDQCTGPVSTNPAGFTCDPTTQCPGGIQYVGQSFAKPCLDTKNELGGPVGTPTGPGGTNREPCPGTSAPTGTDCSKIPPGCPGGPNGPLPPHDQPITCQFTPDDANNAGWTCPQEKCNFNNGQYMEYGQSTLITPHPEDAANKADPELDCGTTKSRLDWIICPVVKLTNVALNGIDSAIVSLLSVDPNIVDQNQPDSGALYYQAWQSFRNIALGILVIAALAMLIGQALGFEVLDAYTLKKVMPRLIIAIIAIALSWEIIKWAVQFTNDLGYGIQQIVFYPFRSLNDGSIVSGKTGILITLLSGGAILALGIGILLSFAMTALLGLLIAFLVLVLRQLIIVVLILSAPLAIACYVLPNTQSIWKLWHESFSKALLMFPIIMAFLATGRVFAEVSSGKQAGLVGQIIAFVAYIIPYFLIPLTFRFAGGALRTVGGFVNDRSSGVFDGLKKGRAGRRKDRIARAKSQHLYSNSHALGRFGNKVGSWATDPGSNAAYKLRKVPGFKGAGARVASQVEHAKISQSSKLVEELQKSGYNDAAYRALSGSHASFKGVNSKTGKSTVDELDEAGLLGRAPTSITDIQKMAEILGNSSNPNERIAASALEGSAGRLANLYKDPEMGKADIQAAGLMGLASHGFANGDDLEYVGNELQKDGGRGYAQSIVSQAQVLGARSRPDIKAGYGVVYKDGKFHNGVKMAGPDNRALSLLKTLQSQDLAAAKGDAFTALDPAIRSTLTAGGSEAEAVEDQIVSWVGPYSQASVDIKARAIDFMNDPTLAPAVRARLQTKLARQQQYNPAAQGPQGQPPPPPPPGQNPPPGPQGSDIRLKRNISTIAVAENGIQLYKFQYLWSDQVYIGVMAQDLVTSHPEALSLDENGFYQVDYSKLGLRMITLEEWKMKRSSLINK